MLAVLLALVMVLLALVVAVLLGLLVAVLLVAVVLYEAVVAVVLQVSRDLVFGAPGHVGITSPSSCPEK